MPCIRCEQLPRLDRSSGRLFIWFPLGHSGTKARRALDAAGLVRSDGSDGEVIIDVSDGRPETAAMHVVRALTDLEAEDTRCLFKSGDALPAMADIGATRSLKSFARLYAGEWFLSLLEQDRLASRFQPIVEIGDRSVIHGNEALVRGTDEHGETVSPARLFAEARDTGLLFNLDLACRKAAIAGAAARGLGRREKVFVNFTPTSIYDPNFCLRSTMAAIDAAGIARGNVVFEVVETERAVDVEHLRAILTFYRNAGFSVALDDMGAGYSSLNLLHQLRPDYVKLDMELVRDVDTDPYKAVVARKLLESTRELGIAAIAEGIETEGELAWCRENGATYGQGYLIGRPG